MIYMTNKLGVVNMIWINKQPIKFTTFPNGETKVDEESIIKAVLGEETPIQVSFKYESDADFMKLFFVRSYLSDVLNMHDIRLSIYYMPYSRMDRSENLSVFTLKYVTTLINSMEFSEVTIHEPHSDVTPALIDRVHVRFITPSLLRQAKERVGFNHEKDIIFFPDAGAQKRYGHMATGARSLVGYKHRDWETGKIDSFQVVGEAPQEPFQAIIVDDLSSYGGTFMAAGEALRKLGAAQVHLVVGHAENSILEGNIFKTDVINKVFTSNSIIDESKQHIDLYIGNVEEL
jgi:ribose-phosphate pyrophosphokinase